MPCLRKCCGQIGDRHTIEFWGTGSRQTAKERMLRTVKPHGADRIVFRQLPHDGKSTALDWYRDGLTAIRHGADDDQKPLAALLILLGHWVAMSTIRHGDVATVGGVDALHHLAEQLSVRRGVLQPEVQYIIMYHLVDDGVLKKSLVEVVVGTDGEGDVRDLIATEELTPTLVAQVTEHCARTTYAQLRHGQLTVEEQSIELCKLLTEI